MYIETKRMVIRDFLPEDVADLQEILEQLTLTTGLRNRGIVYRPGLYVLKETSMPAVLVEMGFISNPYDAELLAYSPDLFATGIYRGILAYYDLL